MERKALVLAALVVAVMLFLNVAVTAVAKDCLICPSPAPRTPCSYGSELDIQMGVPSPSYVGVDLGFLTRGYFSLGVGASFANAETRNLIGGYAKLGILTFDILKGRWFVSSDCTYWYASAKVKAPFGLLPMCETIVWPFSAGFQYAESFHEQGQDSTHLQIWSPFLGINATIKNGQAEIWLELQFPHKHGVTWSHGQRRAIDEETLQLEFGFALCF